MKTKSPLMGIMYVIRNLKEPVADAMNQTDAWIPMWNDNGLMESPVISSAHQQNFNCQSMGQQR